MRVRNAWIGAGIAIAAALAIWKVQGTPAPDTQAPGTQAPSHPERRDAASTPGSRRVFPRTTRLRPEVPATSGVPPEVAGTSGVSDLAAGFDAEPRDAAWASEMEGLVGERISEVAGTSGARAVGVECRARACRLRLEAADEAVLAAAVSGLEEPGGLVGLADTLVIGPIERGDDGVRLTAYAQFER